MVKVRIKTAEFEVFTVFSLYFSLYFEAPIYPSKWPKPQRKAAVSGLLYLHIYLPMSSSIETNFAFKVSNDTKGAPFATMKTDHLVA